MKRPSRRQIRWILLFAVIGIYSCSFVLFGLRINVPGELDAARVKWEAQNIRSYRYCMDVYSYNILPTGVIVTVDDNHVVKLEQDPDVWHFPYNTPSPTVPISADPGWYWINLGQILPEDFSHYTVEELFSFVDKLQFEDFQPVFEICTRVNTDVHYEAKYNRDFGYVEELHYSSCASWDIGVGLMCGGLAPCSSGFRVTDFEVLAYAED